MVISTAPATVGLIRPAWLFQMIIPAAPPACAFCALTAKPHVPRRTSTILPAVPAKSAGAQPSFATVGLVIAVFVIVPVPLVGGVGAAVAGSYPIGLLSGEMRNVMFVDLMLSNDATPITLSPTPGAPADQMPFAPL